jgi:hypothetical protein
MSAATFQKLRNSYDKHKKAGDYNALEKAEREAGL